MSDAHRRAWLPSPSAAAQTFACPAWSALVYHHRDIITQGKSSRWADDGTAAHALVEQRVLAWLHDAPLNQFATDATDDAQDRLRKSERVQRHSTAIDTAVRTIKREIKKAYKRYSRANVHVYTERMVEVFPALDYRGTADLTIYTPSEVITMDYKHGAGIAVSAKNNWQLTSYLTGAVAHLPEQVTKPFGDDWMPVSVSQHIIQPRCTESEPHSADTYDYARFRRRVVKLHAVMARAKTLRDAVASTDLPPHDDAFVRGEHCRYCNAKPVCPRWTHKAISVVRQYKADYDPQHTTPTLNADDMERLLRDADGIASYLEAVKGLVQAQYQQGGGLGLFLTREGATRQVVAPHFDKTLRDLVAEGKLSKKLAKRCQRLEPETVTVLRGLLPADVLEELTIKQQNKPSFVAAGPGVVSLRDKALNAMRNYSGKEQKR